MLYNTYKINYNPLWKKLIDKNLKKKDLEKDLHLNWATISKLSKNQTVSLDTLIKICYYLQCNLDDIIEINFEEN